jgi:hypothetical protein
MTVKHDGGKPRWYLVPLISVQEIVKVMTFGAEKYEVDGWKHIENPKERYFSACMRHLTLHQAGELVDSESGLLHISHAACSLVFLIWFELMEVIPKQEGEK